MVRADAVDGDAAHHDHVLAGVFKAVAERFGGVDAIAAEQALLPQFAHPLRGFAGVVAVRVDAAGVQQVGDGLLERHRVEFALTRDADAALGGLSDGIVVATVIAHLGFLIE